MSAVAPMRHWRCAGCGGLASTTDDDVCECGPCGRQMSPFDPDTPARARDRACAERDAYREALIEIMVRCEQGREPSAAMTRAHHVARRALRTPIRLDLSNRWFA